MDAIKNILGIISRLPLIYFGAINLLTIFWFGTGLGVTKFMLFLILAFILLFVGLISKQKLCNLKILISYKVALAIGVVISLIIVFVSFEGIYFEKRDGYEHAIILLSYFIQIIDKNILQGKKSRGQPA